MLVKLNGWQYRVAAENGDLATDTAPDIGRFPLSDMNGRNLGCLIGFPIDIDRRQVVRGPLQLPVLRESDPDKLAAEVLDQLAGRFVWLADLPEVRRLYPDPTASVPCVFDASLKAAGLTAHCLDHPTNLQDRFDTDLVTRMRVDHEGWLPAGLTAHTGVARLLPNHYLDLETWSAIRFRGARDLTGNTSLDGAVEDLAEAVEAQIQALLGEDRNVIVGLTAGRDTRMVAAAAKKFRKDLTFVTLRPAGGGDIDAIMARRIARKHGLRHRELPLVRSSENERDIYIANGVHAVSGVNSHIFPSLKPLREGHVFVGGTGGELSRGYLWNDGDTASIPAATNLVSRLGLPQHDVVVRQVQNWIDGLDVVNAAEVYEMAYLELREGCWASVQFPCDPTLVRYQPLLADRAVRAMMGISREDKSKALLADSVIAHYWREMSDMPFNSVGPFRDFIAQIQRVIRDPDAIVRRLRRLSS